MPFSDALKLQVKKMAAFRCCRCHEIGIDIHHIIPQAKGGSDDIDNAAPLCQNCHNRFGANAEKRKEIRQMREWWYDVVEEKYHSDQPQFEKINETLLEIRQTQTQAVSRTDLAELRKELAEEIRALRSIQERAVEDIINVPVDNIQQQAKHCDFWNHRLGRWRSARIIIGQRPISASGKCAEKVAGLRVCASRTRLVRPAGDFTAPRLASSPAGRRARPRRRTTTRGAAGGAALAVFAHVARTL